MLAFAWLISGAIFFTEPASAYLPPAFFVYTKMAEQKAKTIVTGASLTVAKPQPSGTEEILGTYSISGWKSDSGGWPTLSLIFDNEPEQLIHSIQAFGLSVSSETELLRLDPEKLKALKEPPVPFYKVDPTMSLKRTRHTYAWVHSSQDTGRSVWIEKDSFLPLKIAAPCPKSASGLGWAKAGEGTCEMEFRNLFSLRRGSLQSTKMVLWKDGAPLLFFTFDRLFAPKSKAPGYDGSLPAEVKELVEALLH